MFFLFILVIFTILIIAIHTSKIGIDIKNLIIDTDAEEIIVGFDCEKIEKYMFIYYYLIKLNYLEKM